MSEPQRSTSASLTQEEAAARAELLTVDRYDIEVDLRGLREGTVWESRSRIAFRCAEPGAETFVDAVGEVTSARLNGRDLDLRTCSRGRLPLPELRADNVLEVHLRQPETTQGAAILRSVDDSDGRVYVWTSFEPDDARRAWACFDQPDLKAPHGFTARAPESWSVLSNSAPTDVRAHEDDTRTWTFADTPPLPTYVVVLNAGPFHEIRERRGGYDLGLWCRQSLADHLARDAGELFRLTEQGLAFYGERFERPFAQERYDQVFVPGMGGAMENWGCVTWTDDLVWRQEPTRVERALVAMVLLHEMAHMWFGDLVTMRWWDDLWLNEAFASWAASWAAVSATAYVHDHEAFALSRESLAYRLDAGPGSHPVRGEVRDVSEAMATFDAITYSKGQAVLRQLCEYVGEDVFARGLARHFDAHAWGNATLDDLVSAIGAAAGRDLSGWSRDWFSRAGHDRLTLEGEELVAVAPDGGDPRPHRLDVGLYDTTGARWERLARLEVTTRGARTRLPEVAAHPRADVALVNDGDLTFCCARASGAGTETMLRRAGGAPDSGTRTTIAATAWDRLVRGETPSAPVFEALLAVSGSEDADELLEGLLETARGLADLWTPPALVGERQQRLADAVRDRLEHQRGPRAMLLRVLASVARTDEDLARVERAASDDDVDLRWRLLTRRSTLGHDVDGEAAALRDRDPDPSASARLATVRGVAPDPAARAEAWRAVFERADLAPRTVRTLARDFWSVEQADLVLPFAHRFFDELGGAGDGGMMQRMGRIRAMMPRVGDEAWLERADALVADPGTDAAVRGELVLGAHTLRRMLAARSDSTGAR